MPSAVEAWRHTHIYIQTHTHTHTHTYVTPEAASKFDLGIKNEAGQSLREFCQENALVIASTLFQQHKRRLYTRTSPDGQH